MPQENKKIDSSDLEQYLHSLGIMTPNYCNNLRLRLILETSRRFFKTLRMLKNVEVTYNLHSSTLYLELAFNWYFIFFSKKKFFQTLTKVIDSCIPEIKGVGGVNKKFNIKISVKKDI